MCRRFAMFVMLLLAGCLSVENALVYHPRPGAAPVEAPPPLQDVELKLADGTAIHARWAPHPSGAAAILYCHGNGGNLEGWADPDPLHPYAGWVNSTGRELDQGVISNILGGSFCPGGEIGWVMRNPSIWVEPYRIKADPDFYNFGQTPAQANKGTLADSNYAFYAGAALSQTNDFKKGLQPGDLTKYMSIPWQADFNECSTQPIDVTYEKFNEIYPDSDNDKLMDREQRVWETLWWPAHRPMQTYEMVAPGDYTSINWLDWTPGVPQTNAGDLKMVTEWWRLPVVKRNPQGVIQPSVMGTPNDDSEMPYISVERTKRS